MPEQDPFVFLSRRSGALRGTAGEEVEEETGPDPFAALGGGPVVVGFKEKAPRDIGVGGAFASGVGRGIIEPFTIITGKHEIDPRVDEKAEQVSEFLGSMVGLGISFVPFSVGTGLAMRGIGLTAKLAPELARAIKFTIAGGIVGAGISETKEEIPGNVAFGVVIGAALEGIFLAAALRNRAKTVGKKLFDDGSPIPENLVPNEILAQEIELAPSVAKSTGRTTLEVTALANGRTYNETLTMLAGEHLEMVRLTGLGPEDILPTIQAQFPEARLLTRKIFGGKGQEVLVQNPLDPARLLTAEQEAQWRTSGFFKDMKVVYGSEPYRVTGGFAAEGRVQIQAAYAKGPLAVIAPRIEEITRPIHVESFSASTSQLRTIEGTLELLGKQREFGLALPSTVGRVRRGVVDASEYEVWTSLDEFLAANREGLLQVEAGSPKAALEIYAQSKGIPGLVFQEEGITTGVRVFEQESVQFVKEVPPFGQSLTQSVVMLESETGKQVLESFVPNWRDSALAALRAEGIPEKEIMSFLEQAAAKQSQRLNSLLDGEFSGVLAASRAQFSGGCV